jgi:hypothetical protein
MSIRIFVEGNDDKKFIISILNDLKKHNEISVSDNINFNNYIEIMGSKTKLLNSNDEKYRKISRKIGFKIEKVLFIFDCDFEKDDKKCGGIKNSKKCFEKLIKQLNWDIEIDYYIFDKNLDYFLVETIKNKECYKDFDKLIKCLDIEKLKPNKKPIANLYKDLYPYPHFNFKDKKFQPIKEKLINLFKGLKW